MNGLPDAHDLNIDDDTWELACAAASRRRTDDGDLLAVQETLAEAGRWDGVYVLSVLAGLETSVLIDADDKVFIDWGTAGQVTLQPPVGGRIPFKLWVHTHPRFAAYWSGTDTNSLSLGAGILETATRSKAQQQPFFGRSGRRLHAQRARTSESMDRRRARALERLVR